MKRSGMLVRKSSFTLAYRMLENGEVFTGTLAKALDMWYVDLSPEPLLMLVVGRSQCMYSASMNIMFTALVLLID